MAAGNVVFYQHALEDLMRGALNLASATLMVSAVSQGYTPSAKSHSSWTADVSSFVVTAAGYQDRLLAGQTVQRTSGSFVTWDASDLTLSAAATIKAKYIVVRTQAGRPVCYFDTETENPTGVEVTQLVIQWNALGIGQLNSSA